MARDELPTDASAMPDVARLVHEVAQTGQPRLLQVGDDAALLSPARPRALRRRNKWKGLTPAEREAVLSAVGAWRGLVDAEQLKRDLDAARSSSSPPLEIGL